MTAPTVSVVSLTWNSARFVEPLLSSLLADASASNVHTEVIVVDNGSSDRTPELLREFAQKDDSVKIIALPRNQGTTVSRNIGINQSKGHYVLILDSDTEVPPGTLRGLVDAIDRIPDRESIGIVSPKLTYPDGGFQESARRFPTMFTKAYRLLRLEALRTRDETLTDVVAGRTTEVDYAISAAWFIPRSVFDRVGLLDERIFYSPEDVEFCARVWRSGLKVWYYPDVTIVHNCQRLTNKKPLSRLGLSHAQGLFRYWWEYEAFLRRPTRAARPPSSNGLGDKLRRIAGLR